MKRNVLILIAVSALAPLVMIFGFYYGNYKTRVDVSSSSNIASMRNLGLASFNLNKSSSVRTTFSLAPSLLTQSTPTNKWWENGVVADPWPQPFFNLPLTSSINEKGLSVGLPSVSANENTISAPSVSDVALVPSAVPTRSVVKSYDDLSVKINAVDSANQTVYSATFVKGVPFVYSDFEVPATVNTINFTDATVSKLSDGRYVLRLKVDDKPYAIYAPASSEMKKSGASVTMKKTKDVVIASLPVDADSSTSKVFDDASSAIVTSTRVDYERVGEETKTTLAYKTDNGQETIVAVLPHQNASALLPQSNTIGNMQTVRGNAELMRGNVISYSTPIPENMLALTLPPETDDFSKSKLDKYLNDDLNLSVNGLSYDGGKELFRLANLTMIAHEAGSATSAKFQEKLYAELTDWLSYRKGEANKYFYYDKKIKGLVAMEPQYGSEQFNDHHFHYGYFLYAAAVLGNYDKDFVKNYGAAVSFLGEDIASDGTKLFPRYRVYDAYEGHSWAGGLSSFGDGNNQESISESVNAWFSLYQWAKVSGNKDQENKAVWLYANESQAAMMYYYENPRNPFAEGYKHSQASILWGGKTDWSTWFSALPEAKHAIIILPLSGGSSYLKQNDGIKRSIEELDSTLAGAQRSAYQDILMLGQSLQDPTGARRLFSDDMPIDNSNSKSYLYYYLAWAEQQK